MGFTCNHRISCCLLCCRVFVSLYFYFSYCFYAMLSAALAVVVFTLILFLIYIHGYLPNLLLLTYNSAGMFGVGGGIVKGPLMLAMGVHPAVSSASSACMILFTSFTATTSYIVFGLLVPDYAVACCCLGFFATVAGQLGLGYIMKQAKTQRNSYIAFSIGFVVLISSILMTFQSLLSMAEGEKHHSGGICGKGD